MFDPLPGALLCLSLTRALLIGEGVAGIVSVIAVFLPRIAAPRCRWHTTSVRGFDLPGDADGYPG